VKNTWRHARLATLQAVRGPAALERWPWRPLMRCLVDHGRLVSASSICGQWLASTTTHVGLADALAHVQRGVAEVGQPGEAATGCEQVVLSHGR